MELENNTPRNVNAAQLSYEDLVRLFEPNTSISPAPDGSAKLCSYDKIASPEGTYYLVAKRGIGKTHILKLLQENMANHKPKLKYLKKATRHIVLPITLNLAESPITGNFKSLAKQFPDEPKSNLWQLAILEEVLIELFNSYIDNAFLPSLNYKMFAFTLTLYLQKNYDAFFDYLKDYRPEEWEKQREKLKIKDARKILRYIPKIKITSPPPDNYIFEIDASAFSELFTEDKRSELKIGTRIRVLSASVWATLSTMKNGTPFEYSNQNILTRNLPKHPSVYVIGDGLDETTSPLTHDEIVGLILAVKSLNESAIGHLGKRPNFKALMAIRSVTRDVVQPLIPDWEQIRPSVDDLQWSEESLRRFMVRYIQPNNQGMSDEEVSKVIAKHFPEPVHYFGEDFDPPINFIFEIAGLRPRRILSYWHECAKQAGQPDQPYQAIIRAEHMTSALKEFARETAQDIAKEYDLEYQGLFDLLQNFATLSPRIARKIPRAKFAQKIQIYLDGLKPEKTYDWLKLEMFEILDILYKVGIIGLPPTISKEKNINWSSVSYVTENQDQTVHAHRTIFIHPSFWNWITNIETETMLRREYSYNLYGEFNKAIIELVEKILIKIRNGHKIDEAEAEYILAKFLALVNLVLEYRNYPETLDKLLATTVISKLEKSLSLFTRTVLFPGIGEESRKDVMDELQDFYRQKVLKHSPAPGTRRNNIIFNDPDLFLSKKQEVDSSTTRFREIKLPLFTRSSFTTPEVDSITDFRKSLEEKDGLNDAVVNALRVWKSLQNRSTK